MEPRIIVYFIKPKQKDRFIYGDRFIIPFIKRLIKGKKTSGVEKVFHNLCRSFDIMGLNYIINLPFDKIEPNDRLIVLGLGKLSLANYAQKNKIVAGIALMTHPSEWPQLCTEYPVAKYLQHSDWAKNVYVPYYGDDICDTWFAGIDTDEWKPKQVDKQIDVLIYNKIRWDYNETNEELLNPIVKFLTSHNLSYKEIIYGQYNEKEYKDLLNNCKSMIFLCTHESQGFACCEALSMNVPVFAWDQGFCLDPNRFNWNDPIMPATSVPFFDEKCGDKFKNYTDFENKFNEFYANVLNRGYAPREYILNNLTLRKSGERMIQILDSVYK